MNKRGQLVFVGIMICMMVFVFAVSMIPAIKEQVSAARTSMDCTNASLSAGDQGACIALDGYLFFFFGTCLAVGLGYIGMKRFGLAGGGSN